MVEGFTEPALGTVTGVVVVKLGMTAGLVVAELEAASTAAFFLSEGFSIPKVTAKI